MGGKVGLVMEVNINSRKLIKKIISFLIAITIMFNTCSITLANSENSINQVSEEIKSDSYIISQDQKWIFRILPQTTIEDFKKSFNLDENSIHVFDSEGEEEIKSGFIGTGMQVTFEGYEETYIVSVIGDLNGDGEIKQIEVSKVIKHVVGLQDYQLQGIYKLSADISGEENVDQKDVKLLINYVVYGRLEIGELARPKAPSVVIIGGTRGENGWYITDVAFKVVKPVDSEVPVSKMTYEIIGTTTNQEEIEVIAEDVIVLENEGVYKIKCYSITESGIKSLASTQEIKIDKTYPTDANLIAKLNDKDGPDYQLGTATNYNVYISAEGGDDTISGIQEITFLAKGANEILETNKPFILTNPRNNCSYCKNKKQCGTYCTKRLYDNNR